MRACTNAPYAARNGGGYTLEAELGITPNGYAEPDFMGWEMKQYGVNNFTAFRPKSPVTLMTPEPTGGIYKTEGVAEFLTRFGYVDQSGKEDRINFGGRYEPEAAHNMRLLAESERLLAAGVDADLTSIPVPWLILPPELLGDPEAFNSDRNDEKFDWHFAEKPSCVRISHPCFRHRDAGSSSCWWSSR